MIKKLLSFFIKEKSVVKEKAQTPSPNDFEIRWLEKADSPFGVEGVDCFKFTQIMMSTTGDRDVVAQFVAQRSNDGRQYINSSPKEAVTIEANLKYDYSGEVQDGVLFKASQMEDKWDIYLYGSKIYFCRSWTGELFFVIDFELKNNIINVSKLYVPKSAIEDGELYLQQQVDYLIKHHLLGKIVPHPLPMGFPQDLQAIAFLSLSNYGKNCCFATYENTIEYKRSDYGLSD
ncbi:hypothetical protein H0A36_07295 [Endozoicomonas sp. SM1973]|uniref:Uncharacterized protein n=1 Tax=Spartinivicinus marinus TaxID=2994442 RepID=A0A853I983_9GAMM|nr:hypothetical protein [Spartinivicinus marinus]MCX4029276.1 hypothetical protein [Spartinivicinus marinus]NYZ65815.1 hypothetical protein [Spartinivicinus marinus]